MTKRNLNESKTSQEKQVNRDIQIIEIIHYNYEDSSQALPDYVSQPFKFKQKGITDKQTGETKWLPLSLITLPKIQSPFIRNYHPNIATVNIEKIKILPTDKVTKIEKYVAYENDIIKGSLIIYDDTQSTTIAHKTFSGKYHAELNLNNYLDTKLNDLKKSGFEVVSNNYHPTIFKDERQNQFAVHLKHKVTTIIDQQQINENILYVYEDSRSAHKSYHASVTFKQKKLKDWVTSKIEIISEWQPICAKFPAVMSPFLTGFKPNKAIIPAISINAADKDIVRVVTYQAVDDYHKEEGK